MDIKIQDLLLTGVSENDAAWYKQRKVYEEYSSLFYPLVRQAGFRNFCDIGSNYGLVGMLAARQGLRVLCVEADPVLTKKIAENFSANNLTLVDVVNAIAGARNDENTKFSLNPKSTLDNRVSMPAWEQVDVRMVRMSDLIDSYRMGDGGLFIKIDTQGFEESVLSGLSDYLADSHDWMIKMEFAPAWLESQGTNPLNFLRNILFSYEVTEFPERISFNTPSLESIFANSISPPDATSFLNYVVGLNANRRGWVDLLVRPRLNKLSS